MSDGTNGNATENGVQHTQEAPATPETDSEKTVPYARFQQVNESRKQVEATLQGVVDELMDDIPEDMRDIVPNLPPADKIKWLRAATKKGLFGGQQKASSPDSKRPGGKPPTDFSNMTPMEMRSMGYKS